ncbi:tetratricopeptide repeat protein [Croceitalea rosinachiae]|uniref:Tetratricopeptide repeat protein n=1 Tax=Croceitalea rosinachiae TaxID=3075596 RepID=A0ABU3A9I8_9FLAO|nr:hypothetical protein [Croceitalea sp. F388]MDT0606197.1 hypothetical protein [Croceitalea sp. F388]
MKKTIFLWVFLATGFVSHIAYGQEEKIIETEESAEVFLEEYTDEFQETFFEALKQKGIQNYDRAINLFLKCKQLDAENNVIDHELSKTYFLDKKYVSAQKYAIEAIKADTDNYWYLDNLIAILEAQSNTIEAIQNQIPFNEDKLQENLALSYFKRKRYTKALSILNGISNLKFKENLTLKINDSLNKTVVNTSIKAPESAVEQNDDLIEQLKGTIEGLITKKEYKELEITAKEALETYPLQPYFYYVYGLSMKENNKTNEAIEIFESAFDYLFDDSLLANKIYKELAAAYTTMGNTSKANEYLSMIKPGF